MAENFNYYYYYYHEIVHKVHNCLSRVHERYRRQTTDGRAIAYSERELTNAKVLEL